MWKGPCEKKIYDMRCIEKCDFFQFFGKTKVQRFIYITTTSG
jgi:hypothetical protein